MKISGGHFDIPSKKEEISNLQKITESPDFWNDRNSAEETLKQLNDLRNQVSKIELLKQEIEDNADIINLLNDEFDEQIANDLEKSTKDVEKNIEELNLLLLLNGPYDKNNCVLEIHPGAGGTESCDWANMLYRMYLRWCEKKGYKITLLDYQEGDEAGIKSVSILVKGLNAYGYLKNEKGVHRLVRLSPFDSNNRRHTSFASVEVTPEIEQDTTIEIDEKDLKIDVYRSTGAGGQGVNTTDSAVRITHLPSKIVVTCQNERSQIQNKEQALKVLKNKLLMKKLEEQEQELNQIKGNQMNIEFGSQIRSYVMHPYSMVKDHRTNEETSNVTKVLDGDIDMFIESNLKKGYNMNLLRNKELRIYKEVNKKNIYIRIFEFIMGCLIISIAYNIFIVSNHIVPGGVGGLAIIINNLFGIDNSIVILYLDIILLFTSFALLGKDKTRASVLGSVLFPIFVKLTENINTYLQIDTSQVLLSVIIGGVMYGFGAGLVFRAGFTTGGTDIVNQIISKYCKLSLGKSMLYSDGLIVLMSGLFFGINSMMYSILILYIISLISDKVVLGISDSKAFYIITEKEDEVKEYILDALGHGVTIFKAKGGYKKETENVLMTVLPTKDYYDLKEGIKGIDKDAFFIITDTYEVFGGE